MTDHKLEDVHKRISDDPIYKNTELTVDFFIEDKKGDRDLTGDKVHFSGENLTTGNDVFDVEASHQNKTQGHTRAEVPASDIDESGIFVFELRWDKGGDGNITDRVQWKQEVKQKVK